MELYHNTTISNLLNILKDNTIFGNPYISCTIQEDLLLINKFKRPEIELTLEDLKVLKVNQIDYQSKNLDENVVSYITKDIANISDFEREYEVLLCTPALNIEHISKIKLYLDDTFNYQTLFYIQVLHNFSKNNNIIFELKVTSNKVIHNLKKSGFYEELIKDGFGYLIDLK